MNFQGKVGKLCLSYLLLFLSALFLSAVWTQTFTCAPFNRLLQISPAELSLRPGGVWSFKIPKELAPPTDQAWRVELRGKDGPFLPGARRWSDLENAPPGTFRIKEHQVRLKPFRGEAKALILSVPWQPSLPVQLLSLLFFAAGLAWSYLIFSRAASGQPLEHLHRGLIASAFPALLCLSYAYRSTHLPWLFTDGDLYYYARAAESLGSPEGLWLHSTRGILYPLILAGASSLGDDTHLLFWFQTALVHLSALLSGLLLWRYTRFLSGKTGALRWAAPWAGLAAAALVLFSPAVWSYERSIRSEILVLGLLPLFSLLLWRFLRRITQAGRAPCIPYALWLTLLFMMAASPKMVVFAVAFLIFFCLVLVLRKERRRELAAGCVAGLLCIAGMLLLQAHLNRNAEDQFFWESFYSIHMPTSAEALEAELQKRNPAFPVEMIESELARYHRELQLSRERGAWPFLLLGFNPDRIMHGHPDIPARRGSPEISFYRTFALRGIARNPLVYLEKLLDQMLHFYGWTKRPLLNENPSEADYYRVTQQILPEGGRLELIVRLREKVADSHWLARPSSASGALWLSLLGCLGRCFSLGLAIACGIFFFTWKRPHQWCERTRRWQICSGFTLLLALFSFVWLFSVASVHSLDIPRYHEMLLPLHAIILLTSLVLAGGLFTRASFLRLK